MIHIYIGNLNLLHDAMDVIWIQLLFKKQQVGDKTD